MYRYPARYESLGRATRAELLRGMLDTDIPEVPDQDGVTNAGMSATIGRDQISYTCKGTRR